MTSLIAMREQALRASIPAAPATGAELKKLTKALDVALVGTALEPRLKKILEDHVPRTSKGHVPYSATNEDYLLKLASFIGAAIEDDLDDLTENFDMFMY
jgi:hypothetical protein